LSSHVSVVRQQHGAEQSEDNAEYDGERTSHSMILARIAL
jgi:hypothetical protein